MSRKREEEGIKTLNHNMIEINNLTTEDIDEDFTRKLADIVLRGEGKENSEFSLAFVGQGRMRQVNKKFRAKNRVTDVLSFPESKVLLEKFKVGGSVKTQNLGEIIICLREVKKNAKRLDAEKMREKEEQYFKKISNFQFPISNQFPMT
jgi:probable rRNA maturation factor